MGEKLNFVFFGTPDVASETLEILKETGYIPSLIITSPDTKSGRGLEMHASPVAIFADQNKIPCLKPEKLNAVFANQLQAISYDLFIIVAYGKMLPENILNMPKFSSINIHYSLLPKYRGASPVESAIFNGDTETGVTIQKMELKMDSGPIIAQEKTEIFPYEKAPELRKRLIKIGGELLIKTLKIPFTRGEKQDETQASFCKKIEKEDGLVDLATEMPSVLYNKFRAYAAWPRTFFFKDGKRMIVTQARLENNQFIIEKVIPEGKKEIEYKN